MENNPINIGAEAFMETTQTEKLHELLLAAKLNEYNAETTYKETQNTVDKLVGMLESEYLSQPYVDVPEEETYSFEDEGEPWFSEEMFAETAPFGSATVMGYGYDLDVLAVDLNDDRETVLDLLQQGWEYTGTDASYNEEENKVKFITFRKDMYNLVIVNSYTDFNLMMKANELCVKLKLSDKADRIAVFDSICEEED